MEDTKFAILNNCFFVFLIFYLFFVFLTRVKKCHSPNNALMQVSVLECMRQERHCVFKSIRVRVARQDIHRCKESLKLLVEATLV